MAPLKLKFSDIAKQAVAEKVSALEQRNAELEAEILRLRAQVSKNDPVFLLNRMRLIGMQIAYFGDNPDGGMDLIREEFSEATFEILSNIFYDMAQAPLSENSVQKLHEAMKCGTRNKRAAKTEN